MQFESIQFVPSGSYIFRAPPPRFTPKFQNTVITLPSQVREPIQNHLTGQNYFLIRADDLSPRKRRIHEITSICNEPHVYDWLFRKVLGGRRYPREMATEWLASSTDGWREESHFVFAVIDAHGSLGAACDIKGADLHDAEIGYWSSSRHSGIMTNAVRSMCGVAKKAGYRSLMARILRDNIRSQGVLERASFVVRPERADATDCVFTIEL
jgi:RimJ/RimL family protein N-acetyltransferase